MKYKIKLWNLLLLSFLLNNQPNQYLTRFGKMLMQKPSKMKKNHVIEQEQNISILSALVLASFVSTSRVRSWQNESKTMSNNYQNC
jgi:hypothetical protein